jgi:hypothetical protein
MGEIYGIILEGLSRRGAGRPWVTDFCCHVVKYRGLLLELKTSNNLTGFHNINCARDKQGRKNPFYAKFLPPGEATEWWQEHSKEFPNVAVMARHRQYLGCPASSAAVERLFSQVGIAFSAKRKSAESDTLEDIMFSRINLP